MVLYLVDSRGSTHHHRWFAIHYYDQAPSSQLLYTFHGKDDVHMPSICCNFVDLHHLHHICICCEKHIIQICIFGYFVWGGILSVRSTAGINAVCIIIIWCCYSRYRRSIWSRSLWWWWCKEVKIKNINIWSLLSIHALIRWAPTVSSTWWVIFLTRAMFGIRTRAFATCYKWYM